MRTFILKLLILFLLLSGKVVSQDIGSYYVVTDASAIDWRGSASFTSHSGNVKLKKGTFIIDMQSIKVLDIAQGTKNNKKITEYLKNRFFNVEKFPEATFEITEIMPQENKQLVNGKLVVKGIINEVSFTATYVIENQELVFKSNEFTIDRTKWNIEEQENGFFNNLKDSMIRDEITISLISKAKKE